MLKSNRLLRNVVLTSTAAYMSNFMFHQSSSQQGHPFDPQGFPLQPKGLYDSKDKLTLAGVGMRRKNLYVVDVDVYLIGLSLSPSAMKAVKQWKSTEAFSTPLAEVILKKQILKTTGDLDETTAEVTLRFVRSVSKAQMIQAFEDALEGCSKEAITEFSDALNKIIDKERGLKQGDLLQFDWPKGGGLVVSSVNCVSSTINNQGLAHRLLEVYVDDKRSVSKDLVQSIKNNIDRIDAN